MNQLTLFNTEQPMNQKSNDTIEQVSAETKSLPRRKAIRKVWTPEELESRIKFMRNGQTYGYVNQRLESFKPHNVGNAHAISREFYCSQYPKE